MAALGIRREGDGVQFGSEAIARKSSLGGRGVHSAIYLLLVRSLRARRLCRKQSTEIIRRQRAAGDYVDVNGIDRIKWLASRSEVVCVVSTNEAVRPDSEPGLRRRCSSWTFGGRRDHESCVLSLVSGRYLSRRGVEWCGSFCVFEHVGGPEAAELAAARSPPPRSH